MNYSFITPDLFIGTTPAADDYQHLRELGVKLIINMRREQGPAPDAHPEPLSFLWLRTFDNPFLPIPVTKLLQGAQEALQVIAEGGKVYSHCAYGRHRGAAMGACILIAQGYDPRSAMRLVKERRPISNPHIFYIQSRILKFARRWQEQTSLI